LAPLPIDRPAPEGRQADRHAEPRVPLLRLGLEAFEHDLAMDEPAYPDSILWRKLAWDVAPRFGLVHMHVRDLAVVV
jgi:hypothetical protein